MGPLEGTYLAVFAFSMPGPSHEPSKAAPS